MKYKEKNKIVYSCKYHVIFCSKYRRKVLVDGIDTRLEELIKEACLEIHADLLLTEIKPEHVHLIIEVDPQFGIHKVVKTIKAKSSHILRQEFHHLKTALPTLWSNSYFVTTESKLPENVVKHYIENQETSQRG